MTDKELDKLFREKFAEQDFQFQDSSWEKARALVEAEDPAIVDSFVKGKFAAQEFVFQESSWLKAQSMIQGMYRARFARRAAAAGLVFLVTLFSLSTVDQNFTMTEVLDYPAGRPAIASRGLNSESSIASEKEVQLGQNLSNETNQADAPKSADSSTANSVASSSLASSRPNGRTDNPGPTTKTVGATSSVVANQGATGSGNSNQNPPIVVSIEPLDNQEELGATLISSEVSPESSPEEPQSPEAAGNSSENSSETPIEEELVENEPKPEESDEREIVKTPKPSAPGLFNPMKGKSSYFGLSFGVRVYDEFDTRGSAGKRLSPTVGLRYSYMFHPKLSLNVSGMYTYRRSTGSGHNFSGTSYSFGAHQHQLSMVSSEVHQIDFPIYLRYQVARGHFLYGGAYVDVVLASKNTTQSATTAPYSSERHSEGTEWGHMPGMRETDYGLVLGYDYRINENWQIGARFQYGFTDWSDDQVFGNQIYDRNQEIKILLEYRIFQ